MSNRGGTDIEKQLAIIAFPEAKDERGENELNSISNASKNISRQRHNALLLSFAHSEKQDVTRQNLIVSADKSVNIKQAINYSPGLVLANDLIPNNKQRAMLLLSGMPTFLREWLFKLGKEDPSSWYRLDVPKTYWGKVGLLSGADIEDFRLVADEVRRGASLIVNSINLSWIRNRVFNKQLLAAAIFRAIENNRYVLLCGNRGVMAVIEPNGAVQSSFLPGQNEEEGKQHEQNSEILLGTVQFLWSKTPFTKTWWL
jgi:predicted amidohydrolase